MVSLVLKLTKGNLDLIFWPNCCFNLPPKHNLNSAVGIFYQHQGSNMFCGASQSPKDKRSNLHDNPCFSLVPQNKMSWSKNNPWFMTGWVKPIKSSNVLCWILIFNSILCIAYFSEKFSCHVFFFQNAGFISKHYSQVIN